MINREKIYIDGSWVPPRAATGTFEVVDPATEVAVATIPACGADDASAAVEAAGKAFEAWSDTSPAERSGILFRIAQRLKERADEMTRTITAEVGMPLRMCSRVQVAGPVVAWERYAARAAEFAYEGNVGHSRIFREPVGVIACITPWNYPFHQITAKVAPALAAGCTVVLKPSEVAPLNAFLLAEVLDEVGLPPGVFNLVTGDGPTVGEALVRHPGVDMVSFTGSTGAGRRVAALAAGTVKRVSLELGGKSAAIMLPDADAAAAVKGTVSACFLNSGQTCSAQTRLLVPEDRYEEVKALVPAAVKGLALGDPQAESSKLGPLVSERQRMRVLDYIRQGLESGAELIAGGLDAPQGLERGWYVQPTVFGRVDPHSVIAQEEIFGPVLSIICYRDEEDAVRIANDTIYGLSGSVWSADPDRALAIARRMRTGQVDINGAPFNLDAPFGGYKQSGYGRENGVFGMEEFLQLKAVQIRG